MESFQRTTGTARPRRHRLSERYEHLQRVLRKKPGRTEQWRICNNTSMLSTFMPSPPSMSSPTTHKHVAELLLPQHVAMHPTVPSNSVTIKPPPLALHIGSPGSLVPLLSEHHWTKLTSFLMNWGRCRAKRRCRHRDRAPDGHPASARTQPMTGGPAQAVVIPCPSPVETGALQPTVHRVAGNG